MSPFSQFLSSPNTGEEISPSRYRQSSRATRRKKTADDLNDGETCVIRVRFFFPLFARSVCSLSLSLSLCSRGFLYAVCREIFFAPFFPLGGAWCRATREGRKRKNKGVAKARLDANRWNRAQKNAARVVFERRDARRRVGRRASASAFARLGFLVLGGPFDPSWVVSVSARVLRLCELTFLFLSFCRSRALLSRDQEQTVPEI